MKKFYRILLLLIVLSSCSIKKYSIIPKSVTTYNPDINQSKTSEIGITLVSKETAKKYDALIITK